MKSSAALVLLALGMVPVSLRAQDSGTSPTPPLPTLRTSAQLVIVDVTVTDMNHHPVHHLSQGDFAVLENNVSQPVKSFEEHSAPSAADLQKLEPVPQMPPGVHTNFTPAPAPPGAAVNILLIDRLNTPTQDQRRLRQDLLDYLKKAGPGQRIAIFGLNTQLVLLQGFTDNPALLREALDKKDSPRPSQMMDPAVAASGVAQKQSDLLDIAAAQLDDNGNTAVAILSAYTKIFEATLDTKQNMDRARRTLDAMNSLARYLVGIPGRKNLIWFSGSFPLEVMPDPKLSAQLANVSGVAAHTDFINVDDSVDEYRETLSLLSRAQVAVYPVDARGLTLPALASVNGEGAIGEKYMPINRSDISGTQVLTNDIDTDMENTFEENNTMRDIAWQTGGRAFLNSNDLAGAMRDALDDGSSYYTLTYTPTDSNWRGDFRKIEVRLRQQGYTLSYRRGYYADDFLAPPSALKRLASGRVVTGTLAMPNFGSMHLALMHGGPQPTGIVFTVKVAPVSDSGEDTIIKGNEGSKDMHPPYRRYGLSFSADPRQISVSRTPDGVRHGSMEFVVFVYDLQGNLINALGTPIKLDLTDELTRKVMQHGIPLYQEVSVPVRGQFFIRMAVHDLKSDHVGAIEVPVNPARDPAPAPAQAAAQ